MAVNNSKTKQAKLIDDLGGLNRDRLLGDDLAALSESEYSLRNSFELILNLLEKHQAWHTQKMQFAQTSGDEDATSIEEMKAFEARDALVAVKSFVFGWDHPIHDFAKSSASIHGRKIESEKEAVLLGNISAWVNRANKLGLNKLTAHERAADIFGKLGSSSITGEALRQKIDRRTKGIEKMQRDGLELNVSQHSFQNQFDFSTSRLNGVDLSNLDEALIGLCIPVLGRRAFERAHGRSLPLGQ